MINFPFPKNFLWGSASSSFQIEGAAFDDGKSESIWDRACKQFPERFANGATPAVASDFYHRFREDIEFMEVLGLNSFRLSIAWPRLLPNGRGKINQKGLAFYNEVIDCLLEHNIEPFVDLYHWDLPQTLQDEGGFENPDLIDAFLNYARISFENFGDRVKLWSTFNEPSVVALSSYAQNAFPPYKGDLCAGLLASQNLLKMHFKTVELYREMGQVGQIGAVIAFVPIYPQTLEKENVAAAVRQEDIVCNWWLRPMFLGQYPESVLADNEFFKAMPPNYESELSDNFSKMDFTGINYYYPARTIHCPDSLLKSKNVEVFYGQSDYGFPIYPSGLYDSLEYIRREYGNPIVYLTENGLGTSREENLEKELDDHHRIEFIREHLRNLSRAIRSGCDIRGYYYWSHFDDFNGGQGYNINFGLLHVDRITLRRTPRKSWNYYKQCILENGVD